MYDQSEVFSHWFSRFASEQSAAITYYSLHHLKNVMHLVDSTPTTFFDDIWQWETTLRWNESGDWHWSVLSTHADWLTHSLWQVSQISMAS